MSAVPTVSRRALLQAGGGTAAAVAVSAALGRPASATVLARPGRPGPAGAAGRRVPLDELVSTSPEVHAARRLTYGATPAVLAAVRRLKVAGWVDEQLRPFSIPDPVCESYLRRFPLLGLGPAELARVLPPGYYDQMQQMQTAAIVRAVWSERQLYELMCEFWWNHFNIGLPNSDVWNLCGAHETTLRAGALGKFSDLLRSMSRSPALLVSLNQQQSLASLPNQNYARELLELHTVGVHAGYSQGDVEEASLLLTGLGLGADGYSFAFDPANHHVGRVRVMGFSDPNSSGAGGLAVIDRYLSYLAHHPATALHLAHKLAQRFVCDAPPAPLVKALAATYLAHDTAIVPVLRQLFSSSDFFASSGKKVRRPVEQVAASLRVLDYRLENSLVSDLDDLAFGLEIMGQAPMGWPQPNGYPDTAANWMSPSAAQAAWGIHIRLAGAWWTETLAFPGIAALVGNPSAAAPAGGVLDALSRRLFFQTMAQPHRAVMLGFLQKNEDEPIGPDGLALLPMAAKVLLDSPYFAVR